MIEIDGKTYETSVAVEVAGRLVQKFGVEGAHAAIDEIFDAMPAVDAAALAYDWQLWARPKQNQTGEFISCGNLTGRGFGKTYGISKWINGEVEAGRARHIGLAAQDEANSIFLQVLGPSGLIATAPPWFKPVWQATQMELVWPNGARAYVRTPEVPGKIRGYDYDLCWLSEIQSWPSATQDEALSNFRLATRIGLARTVWDATPKRRHPLLKELLADAERDPKRYLVVRGTTHENAINLANGYIEELDRKYGGTLRGREELLGEMLEESENALVRTEWITKSRRARPATFKRRVISVDPAITARRGSDRTGIIVAGLGVDEQGYVLRDLSAKHKPHEWAKSVLDHYVLDECDCVVVETNRGGDLVTQNLRAAASGRGLEVVLVGKHETPRRAQGVVSIKEVHARGAKEDRAQPLATAYERGRISHVHVPNDTKGCDLSSLEDTLTTWEPAPGAKSPDDVDALTHAMVELLKLTDSDPDPAAGFGGIGAAQAAVQAPASGSTNLAMLLLSGGSGGGRI